MIRLYLKTFLFDDSDNVRVCGQEGQHVEGGLLQHAVTHHYAKVAQGREKPRRYCLIWLFVAYILVWQIHLLEFKEGEITLTMLRSKKFQLAESIKSNVTLSPWMISLGAKDNPGQAGLCLRVGSLVHQVVLRRPRSAGVGARVRTTRPTPATNLKFHLALVFILNISSQV